MIRIDNLEVNVVRHCNSSCACCNHGSPLAAPYFMDPETLRHDLECLRPVLRAGFLCLQGGEPLLHPRIMDFLAVQKQCGMADKLGMLSNGRLLPQMPDVFYRACGECSVGSECYEIRVSVYPNLDVATLDVPIRKATACGFQIRHGGISQFYRLFKEQPDGGRGVWAVCNAKRCYTVHDGYFYHCPLEAFFPSQFFGQEPCMDGLKLGGVTEQQLADYLNQADPPWMCAHCTGGINQWMPWHQTFEREQWIKEATV